MFVVSREEKSDGSRRESGDGGWLGLRMIL